MVLLLLLLMLLGLLPSSFVSSLRLYKCGGGGGGDEAGAGAGDGSVGEATVVGPPEVPEDGRHCDGG